MHRAIFGNGGTSPPTGDDGFLRSASTAMLGSSLSRSADVVSR